MSYSLILNTKYNPFSYTDLVAPIKDATTMHQALEEEYAALQTKADVWDMLADSQVDQDSYNIYKDFSDTLKANAENLLKNGLSQNERYNLMSLKSRYAKDIAPLELAYQAREAEAKLQRELYSKDNSIRFENDAYSTPLSTYIKTPQKNIRSVSGQQVFKDVYTAASQLAKELKNYRVNGHLDNYTKKVLAEYGFSSDEIANLIAHPDLLNDNEIFSRILSGSLEKSGILEWENKDSQYYRDTLKFLESNGLHGLWAAVGEDKPSHIQDYEAISSLKSENDTDSEPDYSGMNIRVRPFYSKKQRTQDQKDYNDYKQYFATNTSGEPILTEEGIIEFNKTQENSIMKVGATTISTGTRPSNFKKYMYRIGESLGYTTSDIDKMNARQLADLMVQFNTENSGTSDPYDATKIHEYISVIDPSYQKDYRTRISSAGNAELALVDWDSKQKKYVETGDKISMTKIYNDNYLPTEIGTSRYGRTLTWTNADTGDSFRIMLPSTDSTAEANSKNSHDTADVIQQILTGKDLTDKQYKLIAAQLKVTVDDIKNMIKNLTENDKQQLYKEYKLLRQEGEYYTTQIMSSNKIEPNKVASQTNY